MANPESVSSGCLHLLCFFLCQASRKAVAPQNTVRLRTICLFLQVAMRTLLVNELRIQAYDFDFLRVRGNCLCMWVRACAGVLVAPPAGHIKPQLINAVFLLWPHGLNSPHTVLSQRSASQHRNSVTKIYLAITKILSVFWPVAFKMHEPQSLLFKVPPANFFLCINFNKQQRKTPQITVRLFYFCRGKIFREFSLCDCTECEP